MYVLLLSVLDFFEARVTEVDQVAQVTMVRTKRGKIIANLSLIDELLTFPAPRNLAASCELGPIAWRGRWPQI